MMGKGKSNFSRPIIRIAVASIALGVAVMIVSLFIVTGFQQEIRNKVIGFGSHITISNFNDNISMESTPVSLQQPFYPNPPDWKNVKHIQVFATKAGIIKKGTEIEGVVFKGIGKDYDWSFFNDKLVSGETLHWSDTVKSDEIMISKILAERLSIKVSDQLLVYFVNKNQTAPGVRKLKVCGIYETGLEELDKVFVFGDIRHVQRLNMWDSTMVGGFEILVDDFSKLDATTDEVYQSIGYNLNCTNIKKQYPQIFDWLAFQDVNAGIILLMMVIVAAINMVSALLILIIEKTTQIGVLKAMGMTNWQIRKTFLATALYLISWGLFWGNMLAIIFSVVQKYFGIFKLDPESYYVNKVPVNFDWIYLLSVNGGTLLLCILVLILPTYIVTRISPVSAIRFN